jgi:hypothetical protein
MAVRQVLSAECRVLSQRIYFGVFCLLISACATIPTPNRIALLAPFEDRYREIGYDALYAARLALQDAGTNQIELLPIDDGGTVETAVERARALAQDPQIKAALVLGYAATDPETLAAFDDVPVLVVGYWGVQSVDDHVFVLANPDAANDYTIPARVDVLDAAKTVGSIIGGEVLALKQVADLRASLSDLTIVTSMPLPDAGFRGRYTNSDQFAPEPGLFAPLTYEAMQIALQAPDFPRISALESAPIFAYSYDESGSLIPVDRVIE